MIRFLVVAFFLFSSVAHVRAQTHFAARLDASQVLSNSSDSSATGRAQMTLNAEQTELAYHIQLAGLDLERVVASRTDDNDVVAIHIHLNVPDVIGPHILNIFGNPAEEDADRIVDYENETISGIYDMTDATRNPITGELEPQAFPLTTKLFPTPLRLSELLEERWYFAVHTLGNSGTPPGVTIRGNFFLVPEPSTSALLTFSLLAGTLRIRPRSS